MFARSVLRSTAPLRQNARSYASEAPPSGSKTSLIAGLVALTAGASFAFYKGSPSAAAEAPVDSLKAGIKDAPKTFTGGDQGFLDLKLSEVTNINHNVKRLRFELPDKDAVSGLPVASALVTKFKSPDMEKPVIRPYTPVSDEDERGYLDLLIKRYPNGPMSEHMHDLTPGQRLDFKGPIPKYPWEANKHEHIALIAGGTGITPMYQLTRQIFQNPQDQTKVTLVFANMTEDDILLKPELEKLELDFPQRFRAFYTLDNPPDSWAYGRGRVSKDLLQTVIPGPDGENIKIFVCGPPGMYKAVSGPKKGKDQGELEGILKELGYGKEQVFKF